MRNGGISHIFLCLIILLFEFNLILLLSFDVPVEPAAEEVMDAPKPEETPDQDPPYIDYRGKIVYQTDFGDIAFVCDNLM